MYIVCEYVSMCVYAYIIIIVIIITFVVYKCSC